MEPFDFSCLIIYLLQHIFRVSSEIELRVLIRSEVEGDHLLIDEALVVQCLDIGRPILVLIIRSKPKYAILSVQALLRGDGEE